MRTSVSSLMGLLGWIVLFGLFIGPTHIHAAQLQKSERSGARLTVGFQYMLANFSGAVPSQWARVAFDPETSEVYTLNPGVNEIHIFNRQGMEVFGFGGDGTIVSATDIAVGSGGTIYILARQFARYGIQVLDFRGRPQAEIHIQNLPSGFEGFRPDRLEYRNGLFYLLDSAGQQIVAIGADGEVKLTQDLAKPLLKFSEQLDPEKKKTAINDISGFYVGPRGGIYFTVPTLFRAFLLKPDGSLEMFGESGSGPGKFGVVSGITADDDGNIYVADRLRSVVLIFNSDFLFLGEFGHRGFREQDILVPDDLVLDPSGERIYVSQAGNKGVGVYSISLKQRP